MNARVNRAVRLARRPQGLPADDVWEIADAPVPEIDEGAVLVAVSHVSIDPAMRGLIEPTPSYLPPVEIGYAEGRAALANWHSGGRLKAREHVEPGLDRFPEIFRMLFRGANHGKLVLAVDPD